MYVYDVDPQRPLVVGKHIHLTNTYVTYDKEY